jgi:hypothetical protein
MYLIFIISGIVGRYQILKRDNLCRTVCIKRCQVVVKVNIMSCDLIEGYLTFYLNQPIKRADFRLDALLANTMCQLS